MDTFVLERTCKDPAPGGKVPPDLSEETGRNVPPEQPEGSGLSGRYGRNGILTTAEQAMFSDKTVAVIGCGGLGGHVLEMLGRLGVGHLIACDGDRLEPSNLNRQILSTEDTLGKFKAEAARQRMAVVNSEVEVTTACSYLDLESGPEVLAGCDVVVDGLDSGRARLTLQRLCRSLGIPLVHGAIDGWFGQVTTVLPGDDTLDLLYGEEAAEPETLQAMGGPGRQEEPETGVPDGPDGSVGPDDQVGLDGPGSPVSPDGSVGPDGVVGLGNPSFTPAAVAAVQVSETVKVLLGRGQLLRKKILFMDLFHNEFETVEVRK